MLEPNYNTKELKTEKSVKHDKHCHPFPPLSNSPFEKFKEKLEEVKKKLNDN